MRALFSCLPALGHFHPMVPLAQAMTSAGHQVAFATAERFCGRVVATVGFQAFPAGLGPLQVEELMGLPHRNGGAQAIASCDTATGAGPERPSERGAGPERPSERGAGPERDLGARMFAGVAGPAKVADLARLIDAWHPSVVVHDAFDFGAPIAAAHARLPWASHSFGALQPPELWDRAAELIGPTWQEWGVEPGVAGGMFRYLYFDICPPSLQAPHIVDIAAARPLRPVVFDSHRAAVLPNWVRRLPAAPTVYVTLGTVFNHAQGVFETILEGLATSPVNVIVTIGRNRDPGELGKQPGHVRVERYLPHSVLLPECDLVICHGGSGTTFAALTHGLPLLILPQGADQRWNADRCAALGAGVTLPAAAVTPETVRAAVGDLLQNPAYRAAARRIQAEIQAMPGPEVAVGLLEELAERRQPVA